MQTEDLFNIIGKLYVDMYNMQKLIEMLQKNNKDKDAEIIQLKQNRIKDA